MQGASETLDRGSAGAERSKAGLSFLIFQTGIVIPTSLSVERFSRYNVCHIGFGA